MLAVYRIAPSATIGAPSQPFPDVKPPNLLIVGIGAVLAMGAVAAFAYWNETRR